MFTPEKGVPALLEGAPHQLLPAGVVYLQEGSNLPERWVLAVRSGELNSSLWLIRGPLEVQVGKMGRTGWLHCHSMESLWLICLTGAARVAVVGYATRSLLSCL